MSFKRIISLDNLPVPPTINKQLILARGRFIKSAAARSFDQAIDFYRAKNRRELLKLEAFLPSILRNKLYIDVVFYFPKEKLFTKTKTALSPFKKIDTNNRAKSIVDAACKLVGVDDSAIFFESYRKKETYRAEEYASVTFFLIKEDVTGE